MTYVAQHLPPEQLAGFKSLYGQVVFGNSLLLTVNGLQHVAQVCSCQRRLGDNRLHLLLFCFQIERLLLALGLAAAALLLLIGVGRAAAEYRSAAGQGQRGRLLVFERVDRRSFAAMRRTVMG